MVGTDIIAVHLIVALIIVIISSIFVYQFYRLRQGISPSYWTSTFLMVVSVVGVILGVLMLIWFGWKIMKPMPQMAPVMMSQSFPVVPSGGPQFALNSV